MRERAYRRVVVAAALAFASPLWMLTAHAEDAAPATEASASSVAIADHMTVAMDYTLTVEGKAVDTSAGRKPLEYVQGSHQIIPGLEWQLAGLHVGDEREVTVQPEDGYGAVNPAAIAEVAKAQLPKDLTPAVGSMLQGTNAQGRPFRATIRDVHPDGSVTLDMNHPLAGKTLQFKVKIVSITPPPAAAAEGGTAQRAGPVGPAAGGGVTPPQ